MKHRRRGNAADAEVARVALRESQRVLRSAIAKAKSAAWKELLATLEHDPWGRPYRIVMQRLKSSVAATEKLDPPILDGIIQGLLPVDENAEFPHGVQHNAAMEEDFSIKREEIKAAVGDIKRLNSAPGPDGLAISVMLSLLSAAPDRLRRCFNVCIEQGRFPSCWKTARLVLIPKAGKPAGLLSYYRSLCLLSELGKLLERIIARRIVYWVDGRGGFSPRQFGFCRGKSTCDAVAYLESMVSDAIQNRGVCVAVSLDVRNAFNSLPWPVIRDALDIWRIPWHIKRVLVDYLSCRYIEYITQNGSRKRSRMTCGVPQGSVLGPLLWNLTYNQVLKYRVPPSYRIICYADDTLVVAKGGDVAAVRTINQGLEAAVRGISALRLSVVPEKTETIVFRSRRCRLPAAVTIRVGSVEVAPGPSITYLGIVLDEFWSFVNHFHCMCEKGRRVVSALSGILPNLGGSPEKRRMLYLLVLHAVLLYGASIWADRLAANWRAKTLCRAIQRQMANRVICAYRTVSADVALLLARAPPLELLAKERATIFRRLRSENCESEADIRVMRSPWLPELGG